MSEDRLSPEGQEDVRTISRRLKKRLASDEICDSDTNGISGSKRLSRSKESSGTRPFNSRKLKAWHMTQEACAGSNLLILRVLDRLTEHYGSVHYDNHKPMDSSSGDAILRS